MFTFTVDAAVFNQTAVNAAVVATVLLQFKNWLLLMLMIFPLAPDCAISKSKHQSIAVVDEPPLIVILLLLMLQLAPTDDENSQIPRFETG